MAEIVIIKSKLTPEIQKMDLEKKLIRNVYPAASQSCFLKKHPYTKLWLTGYEIEDDVEEIEKKKSKHPEYNKYLERKQFETTFKVDLSDPDDDFLINYKMLLTDVNNTEVMLKLERLEDRFKYNALIAGGYVAPSKEHLNDVQYINTVYYFVKPKEDVSSRKELSKIKNRIGAKLTINEDNKVYLLSVAFKLGLNYSPESSCEVLYTLIDGYKDKLTSLVDAKKTIKIVDEELHNLEKDLIIDLALKYFVVKKSPTNGYVFDGVKLGDTNEQFKNSLYLKEFEDSYYALREKVYTQFKLV